MPPRTLPEVIQQAREQAKAILTALEATGHPQTNQSSSLYLGVVTVQKRLRASLGAAGNDVVADLEQLADLCVGKLESVKPLLLEAVRLARGGRGKT